MWPKCWYLQSIVLTLVLASNAFSQQGIPWQTDLQMAKQQAAASNQLVLVHCWAPWCGVCRRMEQEVLADPAVVAAMRGRYVPVKLNVDQNPDEAKRLGINALPTDVVITPDGQVIERYPGYTGTAEYANRLFRAAAAPRRQATAPQQPAMAANIGGPGSFRQIPPPAMSQPPVVPQFTNPAPNTAAAPTWNAPNVPAVNPTAPAFGNRPDVNSQAPQFGAIPSVAQPPRQDALPPQFAAQPPTGAWDSRANQAPAMSSAPPALSDPNLAIQNPGPSFNGQTPPPSVQTPPMLAGAAGSPAGASPDNLALAGPDLGGQRPSNQPSTSVQAPATPSAQPAGEMPLALDGYCPVTLVEGKEWKLGDRRWGARHQGRTYLFTSQQQQQRFLADPDRYSPVASGNDVVLVLESGQTVAGRREHGVFYGNRIYLFSSEESLQAFSKQPAQYESAFQRASQASRARSYR